MKRFVIDDRMDFAAFRRFLGAAPLQLADVTPKPGDVDPGVTVISAKIPKHESLDPKSVGMALLSVGSMVPYSYDARNGAISLVLKDALSTLKAKYHRAVVWGVDTKTGKRVEATWTFRLPSPEPPPAAPTDPAAAPATAPVATSARAASAAHGGSPKR
jgi:hypothetical protein